MRPPVLRHSSIARSTAQSECGELSTGTKISRYTGTSLAGTGRCEYATRSPLPRTNPGTRARRSRASIDQMGPLPAPGSRPSSKASSLPVVTIPRTISSGWGGSVAPPIFTPSDATSWVSIGFVSSATTRPHLGQRNAAASVPSPGSWRSSNAIWRSHSTHRNFTGAALPLVHTLRSALGTALPLRAASRRAHASACGPSRRTSYTGYQSVPHFRCGMPGNAREQRDPELSSQRVACVSRERPACHVLDDSEARRPAVARRTQGAAHGILGLLGRNGDGDDRWRLGQEFGELGEALHPGRQIDEQQVQPAPRHVRQKLAQRRRLERAAPHEALRLGAAERERTAVLEQQRHRKAANALRAHRRLDHPVVRRATANGETEQLGSGGAVQVRVEHAHRPSGPGEGTGQVRRPEALADSPLDRKSTRLNSSHSQISYAVFCLKKKQLHIL